jgi:hypothetical protein
MAIMKNQPFNVSTFFFSAFITGLLTFISFIAVAAAEEGTGGMISTLLSKLHIGLEFPTYTLLSKFIFESRNFAVYLLAYAVNCIFYGILIERLFTLKLAKK